MIPRWDDEDLGYGIHTWLVSAFGSLSPKPWRLFTTRGRPPKILGYALHDAKDLREHLLAYAAPGTMRVLLQSDPETSILSKPMPRFLPGKSLAYEVLTVPVVRKTTVDEDGEERGKTVEKDLFLHHVEKHGGRAQESRAEVYGKWVRDLLEREFPETKKRAVDVHDARLEGFRLVRQVRYTHGEMRNRSRILRPQALIRGELTVRDPDTFSLLLEKGVGRHKAFGYGMLLLRPAR
ncbi:type I-E CRISPR-associated protein Cas6/Cse3/CasE [Brockia lithotrophica]|nr:type I-E CRISPR-associated protein Cas6/Cse3/CasE [Brockia lithotrophica]